MDDSRAVQEKAYSGGKWNADNEMLTRREQRIQSWIPVLVAFEKHRCGHK